ncbi:MAG: hypothetical protein MJ247_08055 [Alphaproteobacteria bacterium]|nr:hypothetical protein [Alphaproteobacteria bacterium]
MDNKNGVILSPAYDLVSIDIYPKKIVSHEIAMTINGKETYDSIKKQDFEALFKQLKLNIPSVNKEMQKAFYDIRENAQNLSKELNANKETSSKIYDEIIKNIEKRYLVLFG